MIAKIICILFLIIAGAVTILMEKDGVPLKFYGWTFISMIWCFTTMLALKK